VNKPIKTNTKQAKPTPKKPQPKPPAPQTQRRAMPINQQQLAQVVQNYLNTYASLMNEVKMGRVLESLLRANVMTPPDQVKITPDQIKHVLNFMTIQARMACLLAKAIADDPTLIASAGIR